MSATGRWRMELQELPEYQQGWEARMRGDPKASCPVLLGLALTAYGMGWEDANTDLTEREP